MQVYAVVYESDGSFCLARKNTVAYWFQHAKFVASKDGFSIDHAPGRPALPGGKAAGNETIEQAALREWTEETNCPIGVKEKDIRKFAVKGTTFGAAYFLVEPKTIDDIITRWEKIVSVQANTAVAAIRAGKITLTSEIRTELHLSEAPSDNELAALFKMDLRDPEWEQLCPAVDDQIDWYNVILSALKTGSKA